jgi:hypothetical protein
VTGGRRSLARRFASAAAVAAVISALILLPTPAFAACHFFFFDPTGYRVNEGAGKITITVGRDAALNPSSVRVRTANSTAAAGQDYTAVDQRIQFTSETRRTFDVPIREDQAVEGNEQFLVRVSEGQGCQVNPNFDYGEPATVTIVDNDTAAAPPPPPPPSDGGGARPPATGGGASPTASPAPSPTPTREYDRTPGEGPAVEDTPETEATEDTSLAADEDEGGGGSAVPIVVAIALVVAGGAGAGLWWLRRRAAA